MKGHSASNQSQEEKKANGKSVGKDLAVFSGNANPKLAEAICGHLGITLGKALVGRFPEGEIHIQIQDNIRGKDIFIIQPTCSPVNDHILELLLLIDAAKRASAHRITAVLPYYGYARQDRKVKPRVPISAKLVANIIESAGADRLLTMDLHAGQIQGFFDIPVDHIYSIRAFGAYLNKSGIRNAVVVSPDVGGIKMARAYARMLDCPLAIIDKRRDSDTQTKVMNLIGNVKGKNVVMVDDLISTGGSLAEAAGVLKQEGAKNIIAIVVHPVLAGNAVEKIMSSHIERLIVSDSIPIPEHRRCAKIEVISVAPLLGDVIHRVHSHRSVSSLFAKEAVEA